MRDVHSTERALVALRAVLRAEVRVSLSSFTSTGGDGPLSSELREWRGEDYDGFRRARRAVRAVAALESRTERQVWRELAGHGDGDE